MLPTPAATERGTMDTRSSASTEPTTEEKDSLTSGENFWETEVLDRVSVPSGLLGNTVMEVAMWATAPSTTA